MGRQPWKVSSAEDTRRGDRARGSQTLPCKMVLRGRRGYKFAGAQG